MRAGTYKECADLAAAWEKMDFFADLNASASPLPAASILLPQADC